MTRHNRFATAPFVRTLALYARARLALAAFIASAVLAAGLPSSAAGAGAASRGGVHAYPLQGQTQIEQDEDSFACHEWAVGQAKYNPNRPGAARGGGGSYPGTPPKSGRKGLFGHGAYGAGGAALDATLGAAAGTFGGAIAGNAAAGAAVGAVSGLFIGAVTRGNRAEEQRRWEAQQRAELQRRDREAQDGNAKKLEDYRRAYGACMTGRGYQV